MTLPQVLPWLTQRQISAAAHRLSGQSETLVVGVCGFPVDLRADWCSTCPALFHDPRRSRIDPSGLIIVTHNEADWTVGMGLSSRLAWGRGIREGGAPARCGKAAGKMLWCVLR